MHLLKLRHTNLGEIEVPHQNSQPTRGCNPPIWLHSRLQNLCEPSKRPSPPEIQATLREFQVHHGVVVPHVDHADDQRKVRGATAQEADTVPERFPHGEALGRPQRSPLWSLEPKAIKCRIAAGVDGRRFSVLGGAEDTTKIA